jgi:hypothetical protein
LGTDLHRNLLAIDDQSFGLEVWLPDLLGVALGEADIAAELLAFAGDFTLLHYSYSLTQIIADSRANYICFCIRGQGVYVLAYLIFH